MQSMLISDNVVVGFAIHPDESTDAWPVETLYIQTDEIIETDSILTVYSVLTAFSDWEYFDSCLYAFSVPIQNMEIEFNLYSTHVQRWNQAEFIHCVPTGISLKK